MKKPEIHVTIVKESLGYSAFCSIDKYHMATQGDSFEELKYNILEVVNLAFDEEDFSYTEGEIQFVFDLPSFFSFYRVINAKALSERIGMSQPLLAQYISGIKKPSPKQAKRILAGVHQIGKELSEASFIM